MEDMLQVQWCVGVIRRWLWLIVVCTLLATTSAFLVSSMMPPVYSADATLLVAQTSGAGMTEYNAILASEQLALTYARMLTGRPVMQAVVARLRLNETPDTLTKKVKVDFIRETQLLRLSVENSSPTQSALIANTIAETFIAQNEALQEQRYNDSLASIQQQIDEVSAQIEKTQAQIDALGTPKTTEEQAELARLQTILAGQRSTYTMFLQSYGQMRMTAAQAGHNVVIAEPAHVPEKPVQRRTLYTSLAAVIGVMLGVGAAFLLEYLDDTIKTPDDISQTLGLDTLGTIGRLAKEDKELVVTIRPSSPVAEDFRVLRANICFSSVDKPLRTLLVTSPRAAEGRSFIVANLAVAMAQAGFSVVAVDADLRCPRLHQLFGFEPHRAGLTRALLEGKTDGKLLSVHVDGLRILPSGEVPPNPGEMLGSKRMEALLNELAQQADRVLIDSRPVLPTADAAVLARKVDGVLLVVDVDKTRREDARSAMESLLRVEANLIGAVLNTMPTHHGRLVFLLSRIPWGLKRKAKARSTPANRTPGSRAATACKKGQS